MDLVLVDDHEAMREGLETLLERRGFRIVGVAGSVAAAEELLSECRPDVAIVDVNLPDGSGLRLTRRLCAADASLAVMVYTGVEDVATLAEALESGARGFALKVGGISKLVQGLRLLGRGERYVDPTIAALLDAEGGRPLVLTRRERAVFELLAEGLTGEEIAARLAIGPETVRTHIRNGMEKLDAHTRAGAVAEAIRRREIETGAS